MSLGGVSLADPLPVSEEHGHHAPLKLFAQGIGVLFSAENQHCGSHPLLFLYATSVWSRGELEKKGGLFIS